jgi:hypothetical protein
MFAGSDGDVLSKYVVSDAAFHLELRDYKPVPTSSKKGAY